MEVCDDDDDYGDKLYGSTLIVDLVRLGMQQ